jgi:hypothetical protein
LPQYSSAGKSKYRYSSILSVTSALDEGGCSTPRPGHYTSGKETKYPFHRKGWVGLGVCPDRCGKSRVGRVHSTGTSSTQRVAIPTELSRPPLFRGKGSKYTVTLYTCTQSQTVFLVHPTIFIHLFQKWIYSNILRQPLPKPPTFKATCVVLDCTQAWDKLLYTLTCTRLHSHSQ